VVNRKVRPLGWPNSSSLEARPSWEAERWAG
jgi:hypothetical protein